MGFWNSKKKAKGSETPEAFGNEHLAQAPQSIGQDSANEVYKVNYKDQYAMGDESSGYFKPDAMMAPAKNAVAASRLAQGLGWGDLIAETHFATHDVKNMHGEKKKGVHGAVSKAASGEALQSPVFDTHKPGHKGGATDTVKIKGGQAYEYSGLEVNSGLDLSKSNTQKQLNQLQWFDMLIGNMDRHGANILVDPDTGNVTGIDNDLSFGDGVRGSRSAGRGKREEDPGLTKGWDSKFLGLPGQIDQETADALLGLGPEQAAALLAPEGDEGGLAESDLEDFYRRLAVVQREVLKYQDEGKIVSAWDESTYQDALDAEVNSSRQGEIPRSYLQRHDKQLAKATDGDNPEYWRKGHRTQDTTPTPKWSAPNTSSKSGTGPKMSIGGNRATPPAPSSTWAQARPGATKGTVPALGANRSPAPTKPNYPPPPMPTPAPTAPQTRTRSGSDTPIPSLADTVANAPWGKEFKRPKQQV